MRIRHLLLGSAAGLATVAAAQAADLPTRKAAPVEYVRVCDAYGAGFFYIPGTDTCLRVGGLVLAQTRIQWSNNLYSATPPQGTGFGALSPLAGALTGLPAGYVGALPSAAGFKPGYGTTRDIMGWDAFGRVEIDARTQTPWGTVRAFVRVTARYGSGLNSTTGSFQSMSGGVAINNTVAPTTSLELTYLDKAFIQFAGLTAGRVQSFFDFYADAINYEALRGSNQTAIALSYTATFGGGFSATLSLEDTSSHRGSVANVTTLAGLGTTGWGVLTSGFTGVAGGAGIGAAVGTAALTTAERAPDVIANFRVDQPWGSAQLSAALHPVRAALYPSAATFPGGLPVTFAGGASVAYGYPYEKTYTFGYALQGGVQFNLDMLAPGDKLWLQATYAHGAIGYVSGVNLAFVSGPNSTANYGIGVARASNAYGWGNSGDNDCVFTYSGKCDLSNAVAFTAAFKHYWLPTVSSGLFGSFYSVWYSNAALTPVSPFQFAAAAAGVGAFSAAGAGSGGMTNYKEIRLGTNLVWTPVKNFDLGAEMTWIRGVTSKPFGIFPDSVLQLVGLPRWTSTNDAFYGKLRAVRAF